MRGLIDGLESAAPLVGQLPAVFQEDEFAQRFVSAFDVALAPIVNTLDDLDAYVSPRLAPDDFVDWLATWVGVEFADVWDLAARREIVAGAVHSYRRDGTAGGIRDAIALATGAAVEVTDSGGATWAATPATPLPGAADAALHVRVIADDPDTIDANRVYALVAAIKPAHVAHTVEVVAR